TWAAWNLKVILSAAMPETVAQPSGRGRLPTASGRLPSVTPGLGGDAVADASPGYPVSTGTAGGLVPQPPSPSPDPAARPARCSTSPLGTSDVLRSLSCKSSLCAQLWVSRDCEIESQPECTCDLTDRVDLTAALL